MDLSKLTRGIETIEITHDINAALLQNGSEFTAIKSSGTYYFVPRDYSYIYPLRLFVPYRNYPLRVYACRETSPSVSFEVASAMEWKKILSDLLD